LPLRQYQKIRPGIKQICVKHNIPYRQDNVFKRVRMSIDMMVGKTNLWLAGVAQTVS